MSEMPERKVLREVLTKLKKKTISSENRFESSVKFISERFESTIKAFKSDLKPKTKAEEAIVDDLSKKIAIMLTALRNRVFDLISDCNAVLDDMGLYIESLETYSGELDKTLWGAIEKAKKEAEEQIKQREELMKKEPTYRA